LISDTKKIQPKKWWSIEVASKILSLHLDYTKNFANGEQSLSWLQEKAVESKSKFEADQKNREAEACTRRRGDERSIKEPKDGS
jgi:hypothetical protein